MPGRNKERDRANARARYLKNKEAVNEKSKIYYENNRDEILEIVAKYRKNNPEKIAASKQNYYLKNADKVKKKVKQWRLDNLEKVLARARKDKYGLTAEAYDKLSADQGCLCAICLKPHKGKGSGLQVDHDHATKAIRGLLCQSCNVMLGNAKDSSTILESAIKYLADHEESVKCPQSGVINE